MTIKWYLQGPSSTFNDSQVLGEKVEFEVVRAGPSFPIRYWRGQEAVYRFFFLPVYRCNRQNVEKRVDHVRLWVRGEGLTRVATDFGGPGFRPPRY